MIRKAKKSELEEILNVINKSNRNAYRAIIPKEHFIDPILNREKLEEEFNQMTFYVYKLHRIVGVAALKIEKDSANIRWVHVLPEYRKKGIGEALLGHIEKEAKRAGVRRLKAFYVFENAFWARKFYEKLGFKKSESIMVPWKGRAWVYVKDI